MRLLSDVVETRRLKADATNYTAAAGTTNINTEVVDTLGYDGIRFIIGFGAIVSGAATSIKVQQGQAANMSDAADLLGSAQTVADTDDNTVFISEINRPAERYVRLSTLRATQNATVDFVIAELYGGRKLPVTHAAAAGQMVTGVEKFASPAEGTA